MTAPRPTGITRRSVLLGLALSVVHAIWVVYEELALDHIGAPTLFALVQTVVGTLFVLLCWNGACRRRRPAWVLAPAELLTVFILMTNSVVVCASKFLHYLFPVVMLPLHRPGATGGDATLATLPRFFAPRDPEVVRLFFEGGQERWTVLRPEILTPWLVPLAFWSAFTLLLLWTMLCLGSLARRQWIDRERLPFPIVDLPVLMARENHVGALLSDRTLLCGALLAAGILSLNYVSSLVPSVHGIKLAENDVGTAFLTTPPWSSVNPLLTVWWPYAIGLCFLVPLDVSFSSWFLFALIRLMTVGLTAMGWRDAGSAHDASQFPWFGNLSEGAWLGMVGAVLWSARPFLRQLGRSVSGRVAMPDEADEALPYRVALWGAAAGFVGLMAAGIAAGMRPQVVALAFFLYFVAVVAMARMYAQVALPFFAMAFFSFASWTTTFTGTAGLTGAERTVLTTFTWFDRTYEQLQIGHHLEALALADRVRQRRRSVLWLIVVASVLGTVVGMATLLQVFYERGASTARVGSDSTWLANFAWARMLGWAADPKPVQGPVLLRTGISAAIVWGLSAARWRWVGFPIHPIGYLFATSFALEWGLWNVVFVTWLAKALVMRYGGLHLYRRVVPFFLGLALGDAVTHFFWGIFLSVAGIGGATPY